MFHISPCGVLEMVLLASLPLLLTSMATTTHDWKSRENEVDLVWEQPGDLQLGVVLSMTSFHKDKLCGEALRQPSALHRLHAMIFALEEINQRHDLLPSIQLGFVVMDDCSRDAAALLRALRFIQNPACPSDHSAGFAPDVFHKSHKYTSMKSYPVVGVIGAELSESSMQMAALLSAFHIPQLSYASSSPFLSDKNKYGYFSRIVPSDRQQAKVIADMLHFFHWTYVAVVYSYDVYGLSGFRYIRNALEGKGFCLAAAIATESEYHDNDYDELIEQLDIISPRVTVVVLFTIHANSVLRAAHRKGVGGQFMWVSSDALVPNVKDFKGFEDVSVGLLLVSFKSAPVRRFEDQFQYSTLRNSSKSPWFVKFYQKMFKCTVNNSYADLPPCDLDVPLWKSALYERNTSVMRAFNSVYTFAHALHRVTLNCNYTSSNVSKCFTSEQLLKSLRQTRFVGENNVKVGIDSLGDGIATYQIRNLRMDNGQYRFSTVGEWDGNVQNFTFLHKEAIMWHHGLHRKQLKVGSEEGAYDEYIPISTCRQKCDVGQQAVPTWPRCCWICKDCRENEITIMQDDMPICYTCPSEKNFTWPDPETRTRCEPIPVHLVSYTSAIGLALMALDLFVLALVCTCTVIYVRSRTNRLIKATSRELSGVMLCGHLLACVAVLVFLLEPTSSSCLVAYALFHVSLTLVYAPLLVKINRIYRIFVTGKRSAKMLRFIGSGFQLLVSLMVVLVHLLFIITWMILSPPTQETRMPNFSQKYVERVCVVSERGFLASLIINLVLMAACAVHSLSTRKLPANYNEAKFITICIYTIVVLWLSFLATYFVMDNGMVHVLCLALALLVNVISCQVFLFIPKLYAVFKLPSSQLHVVNEQSEVTKGRTERTSNVGLQ